MSSVYLELDKVANVLKKVVSQGFLPFNISTTQSSLDEYFQEGIPKVLDNGPLIRTITPALNTYKIGLDGGSRKIGCDYALEIIATVAVYAKGFYPFIDYPPAPLRYPIDIKYDFEWIGLLPYFKTHDPLTYTPNVKVFDKDYDKKQAYGELRLGLETRVLDKIMPSVIDFFLDKRKTPLIILDGLIYEIPGRGFFKRAKEDESGKLKTYGKWYENHIKDRIRIIENYLKRNVPVVSVVKRLDKSRYLVKSLEVRNLFRRYGFDPNIFANDEALAYELFKLALNKGILSPPTLCISTAPMEVNLSYYVEEAEGGFISGFERLGNLLINNPKVFVYVGVLGHPLSADYIQVFRVETLKSVYEKFGDIIFREVIGDTVYKGFMLPTSIIYSDKRCKEWGGILFRYSGKKFMEYGLPLDYDTRLDLTSYGA